MTKANKILIIVLVVQAVLAAITWTAVRDTPEVTQKNKLFDFESADVTKIEVVATQGEDTTAPIVMEKKGDGWLMSSADGYPIKSDVITELLDSLTGIQIETPEATTAGSHSKLNVAKDAFDRKVTLTADGKSVTAFLGRGARSDAHVRLADSNDVYSVGGLSVWDINSRASHYVDQDYVIVDSEKTKSITITNAKGSINIVKDGDSWTIPGLLPAEGEDTDAAEVATAAGDTDGPVKKEIDSAELKRLADKLLAIKLVEPVGKKVDSKWGFNDGATVVIATEKDGKPTTVKYTVGAKDGSNRYVKAEDNEYVVKVSNFVVEPVTEKVATDFIKEVKPGDEPPAPPAGMGGMQGMPPGMMMPQGQMPPGMMMAPPQQ